MAYRRLAAPSDVDAVAKKLGRGINLGNALEAPKEGDWGVTLKTEYFQAIKEAGFDSVRLPVKWSAHAKVAAPYTIDADFAKRIDWAVDQALAQKLIIIVNVHHYGEMDADPDKHLPRLIALWEQIAQRHKDRPPEVVFELLNEPHDKLTDAKWNAAIPRLLAAVRKTNPTRAVVIGPTQWNSIRALDKLELPEGDRNLIVTIHSYDPYEFTHQGAPWDKNAAKWKGASGRAPMRRRPPSASRSRQPPLGAGRTTGRSSWASSALYQEADMESRARWTRFVVEEAERLGFAWAYWEFCAGFGAYDPKADAWRPQLKAALFGR